MNNWEKKKQKNLQISFNSWHKFQIDKWQCSVGIGDSGDNCGDDIIKKMEISLQKDWSNISPYLKERKQKKRKQWHIYQQMCIEFKFTWKAIEWLSPVEVRRFVSICEKTRGERQLYKISGLTELYLAENCLRKKTTERRGIELWSATLIPIYISSRDLRPTLWLTRWKVVKWFA